MAWKDVIRVGYPNPAEELAMGIYRRPVCHNGVLIWPEFRRFMNLIDTFLGRIGKLDTKAWLN